MDPNTPLYNSRITKAYVEYLARYHPAYDVDSALERAGIARTEVEDPAHWFTQEQVDRFHDILARETRNAQLSRDVGRYAARSRAMSTAKRYTLGMLTPSSVYLLAGKIASHLSRGARVDARMAGSKRVEITAVPEPGVEEKPYQCENRRGNLEAVSLLFSDELAAVEHPECVHRGGQACRYLVHIPRAPHAAWKRARNAAAAILLPVLAWSALTLPAPQWVPLNLALVLCTVLLALIAERTERKNLARTLRSQGEAARGQLDEMTVRANNALLIQEIGQAASSILEESGLIRAVLDTLDSRLDFDRGLVLLHPPEKGPLAFAGGFGYSAEQVSILEQTAVDVPEADASGPWAWLREWSPRLLNGPEDIREHLPPQLAGLLERIDVRDCICAPMICERTLTGLLIVHHATPRRPMTQSDLRLLEGVASHTAVSIANARGYRKLEESERNYRELVQASNSVILRTSPDGRITFCNRFGLDLFGFSEEEFLGRHVVGTILPDTPEVVEGLSGLMDALRKDPQHPVVTETRNLRRNGDTVWIAWTYRPLFEKGGRLKEILCIGNDITEMAAARKESEELKDHLNRARRMEAVGSLAGGVAHELNNILSGVVSYPELLLMDLPSDSALRKPVETIRKSGEKAAEIVQDMLLLSRRGVTTTEPLNLNHFLRMSLDNSEHRDLAARHPKVHLELVLEDSLALIPASPEHLLRALQSLILNGFLAMPEGGTLRIETENRTLGHDLEGYELVKAGSYAVLQVSDEGTGLSAEDRERIFEPFYTKKALKRVGTGLGLPVVWGIVKDHQGFVDVRSGPDGGATFTLYFPAASQVEAPLAEPSRAEETLSGHGEIVLVVDDVPEQRTIASGILDRLGYRVLSFESGEAAVSYLKEQSADLVVLDMVMEPGMDGLDTYKRILHARPRQKAIIASGYSETERVREARRIGVGQYLRKPYTVESLGRAVRDELDRPGSLD